MEVGRDFRLAGSESCVGDRALDGSLGFEVMNLAVDSAEVVSG